MWFAVIRSDNVSLGGAVGASKEDTEADTATRADSDLRIDLCMLTTPGWRGARR